MKLRNSILEWTSLNTSKIVHSNKIMFQEIAFGVD